MSKVRRLLTSVRYKYGGIMKRITTFSSCILLIIFLYILIVFFSVNDNEPKDELSSSKLDNFQAANLIRETIKLDSKKKIKYTFRNISIALSKVPKTVPKILPKDSYSKTSQKSIKNTTDSRDAAWVRRYVLPAIKIFYKKLKSTTTTKTTKVTTKEKKITYRDMFEALAHPRLFPQTTVATEFRDAPPRIGLNDWIQANSPRDKDRFLVYSAYWDDRFDNYNNVRVMAVMVTKFPPTVYCRLLMPDDSYNDVRVARKVMNEHWRLRYASYLLSCEVSKNLSPPSKVLLSLNRNFTHSALLPVFKNKEDSKTPKRDIAVCVKPLHYYYNRATWLTEFIELHRMLGVEHFFFYNHSVGQNVDILLRHYMQQKIVTVLPWNLPVRSQKEIRTEGIFSSLNDCVFRTMYLFHYVILLDFDEYIIPREHDNYLEMLEKLEEDNKHIRGKPGSFVFRNTFFYLYWENDTTLYGVEPEKPPEWMPYLITQYKTRRLSASMKPGSRSKYIVVPDRVLEVGNHVVWRHTSGKLIIC